MERAQRSLFSGQETQETGTDSENYGSGNLFSTEGSFGNSFVVGSQVAKPDIHPWQKKKNIYILLE